MLIFQIEGPLVRLALRSKIRKNMLTSVLDFRSFTTFLTIKSNASQSNNPSMQILHFAITNQRYHLNFQFKITLLRTNLQVFSRRLPLHRSLLQMIAR